VDLRSRWARSARSRSTLASSERKAARRARPERREACSRRPARQHFLVRRSGAFAALDGGATSVMSPLGEEKPSDWGCIARGFVFDWFHLR
jgi:hypothetical protein